ncbi:LPS-assembly protein LptD [uncultured Deefgea sp.]|uniref:LPS-assembly protein LptD n=1 Tax=uncultured Deefgea sp. TaxID=1304914 RepID=UPI002594D746|nr:LPS-assembly protein LptD [uncultured Deefgea sp.]
MRVRNSPPYTIKIVAFSLAILPVLGHAAASSPAAEPPLFIEADQASVQEGQYSEARGNVIVNRDGMVINADWVKYELEADQVHAGDKVKVTQQGDTLEGDSLNMTVQTRLGEMDNPIYHMAEGQVRGDGVKVLFGGKDKYIIQKGRMTTCRDGQDDWYLHAREIDLDYTSNYGQAWHGWAEFKGVPFFYYPFVDFPLNGDRKSGLLLPTLGYSNTNGLQYSQPYYFNLAPNYDATITPSYFGQRGVMLGGEFRYLQPEYAGTIRAAGINDKSTDTQRYGVYFQHNQLLSDRLSLSINYQKVSDSDYFIDFSDTLAGASQVNLPQEALLNYNGDFWSTYLRVQRYQTLQTETNPVADPYWRMPQWYFTASPQIGYGLETKISGEVTRFVNQSLVQGDRAWINPSISLPMSNSYGFITPRLSVHANTYRTESATGQDMGNQSFVVPIASIDTGLFFEREGSLFGSDIVQTLEPRAFYVYAPYKSQSDVPNYDSAVAALSWSQLFSENKFTGNDRINDANNLTLAISSRIFDDATGIERFYAGVGQQFYFTSPRVTLSGPDNTDEQKSSNLFLMMGSQLPNNVNVNYLLQQDLHNKSTVNSELNVSWTPSEYKTLNLRYVHNKSSDIEQADISGQWPLGNGWYAVGRYNYSLNDRKALETIAGVEYNAGCWALRFAAQSYVTTNSTYKTNYFAILELGGLAGLGMNPISLLKQSIPGYADTYRSPKLR